MTGEDASRPEVAFDVSADQGTTAQTGSLSVDEALRLLANRRRRTILRHLMNHPDGPTALDDLVDLVLTAETSSTAGHHQQTDKMKIDIQCIQVPYLANAGVIEYEADTEQVHYQAHSRLEALLQCVDRWS